MSLGKDEANGPASAMMNDQGGDGKFVRKLLTGPIVHETLSEDFIRRVKAFKAILAEVETISLELTLDSFRRDHNPEKELHVWEHIAKVYAAAMAEYRHLSLVQKKEVLSFLLSLSMGDAGSDRFKALMPEMIVWIAEEHLGRHSRNGRAGLESEYSENVPSDLEFLGGGFTVLPVRSLQEVSESDSPGLRVVKEVLLKALEFKGYNFSVQPGEEYTRVRGKRDGKWYEFMRFPAALHKEFIIEVSRLWCRTTSASMMEWRLPFDGLLLLSYPDGDWYDVFVSAVAGVHGFIMKFTFCDREKSFDLDLDKLGFDEAGLCALKQAVDATKGMVLVTGPTHSGKSIVCYSSVMRRLRKGDSATTIEAPRKFRLPGARQIRLAVGGFYERAYPNALADDPQVLLVQDLRSFEEIDGALAIARDRLVVAAIHAWEVLPCLRRLRNYPGWDRDPDADQQRIRSFWELIAENLSLVCSGRQVNLLCPHCKREVDISTSLMEKKGLHVGHKGTVPTFEKGNGCEACRGWGIMKQTGIYEVLPISPAMRRLLALLVPDCAFIRQAREDGLVSLRETALKMVLEGSISFQDAVSVTPEPYHKNLFKNRYLASHIYLYRLEIVPLNRTWRFLADNFPFVHIIYIQWGQKKPRWTVLVFDWLNYCYEIARKNL